MCDTTIATKLTAQLKKFLGRISPHFHKPVARFIGDMIYGIMVEKDVKLAYPTTSASSSMPLAFLRSKIRSAAYTRQIPAPPHRLAHKSLAHKSLTQ